MRRRPGNESQGNEGEPSDGRRAFWCAGANRRDSADLFSCASLARGFALPGRERENSRRFVDPVLQPLIVAWELHEIAEASAAGWIGRSS